MSGIKSYKRGHVAGERLAVDSRIKGDRESNIAYDAIKDRWECGTSAILSSALCFNSGTRSTY